MRQVQPLPVETAGRPGELGSLRLAHNTRFSSNRHNLLYLPLNNLLEFKNKKCMFFILPFCWKVQ